MRVIFTAILCLLIFTGCAASRKTINTEMQMQDLKNRISYLENNLERKDREVERLNERIERSQDSRMSIHQENVIMKDDMIDADGLQLPIKDIQKALKNAGFYKGAIDGKFGGQTKEGIVKFQKDNNLKADGVVGPQTWSRLRRFLRKK